MGFFFFISFIFLIFVITKQKDMDDKKIVIVGGTDQYTQAQKLIEESGMDNVEVINPEGLENSSYHKYITYKIENTYKDLNLGIESLYPATKAQRNAVYAPIRTDVKIGRNESCPCGSGKKNKKCCKIF